MATTVPGAFFSLLSRTGRSISFPKVGGALPQQAKRPTKLLRVLETEDAKKPYLNISVQIDAVVPRHLAKSLP